MHDLTQTAAMFGAAKRVATSQADAYSRLPRSFGPSDGSITVCHAENTNGAALILAATWSLDRIAANAA